MALPLFPILAPALAKTAIGGLQTLFGHLRGKNLQRPTRRVSPAIQEGVARTRYLAQGEDPQTQYMREQAAANQAGAVAQVQKAGGTSGTTMAAALGAQKQAGQENLRAGQMGQQFRTGANMQYLRMLQNLAREHQLNFEWNEAQRYQEEADAARMLSESGMQNLMTGVTDVAGGMFAHKALTPDPTESPYWNRKKGYMGTVEQYEANQAKAIEDYKKSLAPSSPPAPVPERVPSLQEGVSTEGWMNPWMPPLKEFMQIPQRADTPIRFTQPGRY